MAIVVSSLLVMISTFAFAFTLATLLKVARVHCRGYFLSCSIFSFLATFAGVTSHFHGVVYMASAGGFWKENSVVPDEFQEIAAFLLSSLTICTTLNLGLMWIEFVHTTRRAEHVHSNLHKTAIWLYAVLVLWLAIGAALLILSLRIDRAYFKVWQLANAPFAVLCTAIYIAGGRSMHGVFLGAEQRCIQQAALIMIEAPDTAAQELQKAHRMRARAKMTLRSYQIFGSCGMIYVCSSIGWAALEVLEICQPAMWISHFVLRCSVYIGLCDICWWLYACVCMEESYRESAVEAVVASFTNATPNSGALPIEQNAPSDPDVSGFARLVSLSQALQSKQAARSTISDPIAQPMQPAEPARPSPPAEPSPPLPPSARYPARCRIDAHGAGGASTSQRRVDEQAAIAPQRLTPSGSSVVEHDVRVRIASEVLFNAATTEGAQSRPSHEEIQNRSADRVQDDIYCA